MKKADLPQRHRGHREERQKEADFSLCALCLPEETKRDAAKQAVLSTSLPLLSLLAQLLRLAQPACAGQARCAATTEAWHRASCNRASRCRRVASPGVRGACRTFWRWAAAATRGHLRGRAARNRVRRQRGARAAIANAGEACRRGDRAASRLRR